MKKSVKQTSLYIVNQCLKAQKDNFWHLLPCITNWDIPHDIVK